ncbi:hypothetical protein M2277_006430 [Paenibacillus sp. LBL]|uniref:DUF4352 domain-containing protein n=1 Tax=Paenibacillus sp. LBL TaxID=2940563 RepID=UPI002474F7E8|nr:DUF4352 domain-containing protein [Paenibacillus sp. LBL]MDH6675709.1 hypothetical protein [Paenibacillus sp. LBL]
MKIQLTKGNIIGGIAIVLGLVVIISWILSIDIANEPPQPTKQYGIGDELIDGPFGFTITEAKRNGEKVTLIMRVKNHGSQAETLYSGTVRLRDVDGKLYEHDSDRVAKGTLNPGMESEGKITFQLPEDARGLEAAINANAIQAAVDKSFGNKAEYKTIDIGL